MNCKEILEEIFRKNGIKQEIKEFDSYIDPKCKSAKSIYSKLIRLYSIKTNKTNFSVSNSGIQDLLRMTVIVEYSEVIPTIKKLKETFSDLTGYIKKKNSGYHGIHLNLKVDGIPCEIQLTPKIVVMAVDYLHTLHEKWRDFDSIKEMNLLKQRKLEILKNNNTKEKNKLLKSLEKEKTILLNKIKEEQTDFELRKKTYYDVFDVAKFSLYQNNIGITINKLNETNQESPLMSNIELINIFNINLLTNGQLDKNKVKQVAEQLETHIKHVQYKFVNLVKNCLLLQ